MSTATSPPAGGVAAAATPAATVQAGEACPLCGAPLHPDQEWCLSCGAAARTRLAASPSWKGLTATLAVVVALALGVLAAALVSLAGDSGAAAPVTRTVTTAAAAPATTTATIPTTAGAGTIPTGTVPGAAATGTGTVPGAAANGTSTVPSSTSTQPKLSRKAEENLRKLRQALAPSHRKASSAP